MISDFITQIKNRGLARANSYEVSIPMPGLSPDGAKLITLFCDATNLPGMSLASQPVRMYGEAREMPYEPIYEPVQLSFYLDSGMEVKMAFERWMNSIINPATREMKYYSDYVRDVSIKVVNRDNKSPYAVTLFEAYPKTISSIQMEAQSRDIIRLNVTLQYKYWRPAGEPALVPAGSQAILGRPSQDPRGVTTGQGQPSNLAPELQLKGNVVPGSGGP